MKEPKEKRTVGKNGRKKANEMGATIKLMITLSCSNAV